MFEKKQTVAQHLWNHLYAIEIQHKFFYTEEHRQVLPGMSGVTFRDEDLEHWANDVIQVHRTAVQLVHLHDEGIPFMIVKPADMLSVYEKWNQHLWNWKSLLERPFCAKEPPPPKDFLMIENFVSQIAYVAESLARQRHYTEALRNQNSGEDELWTFMLSLGNNFGFNERQLIQKQENVDVRFLDGPVKLKTAWEASCWGQMAEAERKAKGEF